MDWSCIEPSVFECTSVFLDVANKAWFTINIRFVLMCLEIASFAYTSDGKELALGQIIQIVLKLFFKMGNLLSIHWDLACSDRQ